MTRTELTGYRNRLTALAERLRGELRQLTEECAPATSGEANGSFAELPLPLDERGSHQNEEEVSLELFANEAQLYAEVEAALERLDRGTFGCCVGCAASIGKPRLETLPYAALCIGCASKQERSAGAARHATLHMPD